MFLKLVQGDDMVASPPARQREGMLDIHFLHKRPDKPR
jgi:hypothetical protein